MERGGIGYKKRIAEWHVVKRIGEVLGKVNGVYAQGIGKGRVSMRK